MDANGHELGCAGLAEIFLFREGDGITGNGNTWDHVQRFAVIRLYALTLNVRLDQNGDRRKSICADPTTGSSSLAKEYLGIRRLTSRNEAHLTRMEARWTYETGIGWL